MIDFHSTLIRFGLQTFGWKRLINRFVYFDRHVSNSDPVLLITPRWSAGGMAPLSCAFTSIDTRYSDAEIPGLCGGAPLTLVQRFRPETYGKSRSPIACIRRGFYLTDHAFVKALVESNYNLSFTFSARPLKSASDIVISVKCISPNRQFQDGFVIDITLRDIVKTKGNLSTLDFKVQLLTLETDSAGSVRETPTGISLRAISGKLCNALTKRENLYQRFNSTVKISKFQIAAVNSQGAVASRPDSSAFAGYNVTYTLNDLPHQYCCYFESNRLKMKLKGAALTSAEVATACSAYAAELNERFKAEGSQLQVLIDQVDDYTVYLNGYKFVSCADFPSLSKSEFLHTVVYSDEFKSNLLKLARKALWLLSLNGESVVAFKPANNSGVLEFIPVRKSDSLILASAVRATPLNARSYYD